MIFEQSISLDLGVSPQNWCVCSGCGQSNDPPYADYNKRSGELNPQQHAKN